MQDPRQLLLNEVLEASANHYMLHLGTGSGKSRCAIEKLKQLYPARTKPNILVLVPQLNLIEGWKIEFKKWKGTRLLKYTNIMCYASFKEDCIGKYSAIVMDEGHHTTPRVQEILSKCKVDHLFTLSATFNRDTYWYFKNNFKGILEIKKNIHQAIDEGILPEPIIYLYPIELDNKLLRPVELKKPSKYSKQKPIRILYKDRFKYTNYTGGIIMMCTAKQYSEYLDSRIEWATNHNRAEIAKFTGNTRLKFLSSIKTPIIKQILKKLNNERTITFTGSIDNSIELGYPRVDSKCKEDNLTKFNNEEIDHISVVAQVDEGANLTNCKIGIFQVINTSSRMSIQRAGRVYRHPHPVLVFPYYVGSREEINVKNITQGYKEEYIKIIHSIDEIKL